MNLVLSGGELVENEPIEHLLKLAEQLDVQFVELWYPKNFDDGVEGVKAKLDERAIKVASVASGTEMVRNESTSTDRITLLKAIGVASELGAGFANTYFGYRSERNDDENINRYAQNIAPCVKAAEAAGVVITLENEFDSFGHDPKGSDPTRRIAVTRRLVDEINSHAFRITFDPCNAYFAGLEPFPAWWNALAEQTAYVHIKDGYRLEEAKTGPKEWVEFLDEGQAYTTCPLGEGAINWPGLLERLDRDRYRGFFALEPHAKPEYRDVAWEQAVRKIRQWKREVML